MTHHSSCIKSTLRAAGGWLFWVKIVLHLNLQDSCSEIALFNLKTHCNTYGLAVSLAHGTECLGVAEVPQTLLSYLHYEIHSLLKLKWGNRSIVHLAATLYTTMKRTEKSRNAFSCHHGIGHLLFCCLKIKRSALFIVHYNRCIG